MPAEPVAGTSAPHPQSQSQPAAAEYRAADLAVFYAGADLSLVHSRDSGAAAFYRAGTVDLLTSLRDFRTLDGHLRDYLAGRPGTPVNAVRRELVQLNRAGFLVSREEILAGVPAEPAGQPISTVGFPTCGRPELLRRAVTSYADNCARHGRTPSFAVLDDSPEPMAERCRSMLTELGPTLDLEIRYAGPAEKADFARELAEAGGVPVEVVRYACLGERRPGVPTVGANRNSLLLHAVGERLFSADDDTVCRLAAAPERDRQVLLTDAGSQLDSWFFGDRDEAFGFLDYAEPDLLGLHEEFLGRAPAAVLASAGGLADFTDTSPALLRRLRSRPGRILVTGNGTVGDCGWDNPDFALFAEGASFNRLTRSAEHFGRARASRELAQAVRQPVITGSPDPRLAMCIGLDNTELLAPFPPDGRAEEVAFGAILACCFRDGYGAHLPWLAQHDPIGERRFSDEPPFVIGFGSWLPACIGRFDPGSVRDPAGRLRGLGEFLEGLGRWPAEQFDDFARMILWESMSALVEALTARLDGAEPVPDFWAADARRFIAAARRQALAPVAGLYSHEGGRSGLQRSLVRFGELLCWWPRLVAAAAELRSAGRRLARPVAGGEERGQP